MAKGGKAKKRTRQLKREEDRVTAQDELGTPSSLEELLRVERGFVLADVDPRSTPGFDGGKASGQLALEAHAGELGDWQERLFAETKVGGSRSVLLVIQGMDTAGKGGIMKHVVSQLNPEGVRPTAFKAPTDEEREHDFLWRVRNAVPGFGQVGVFDRSHYEDVLVVRVHELVPKAEWSARYPQINAFERELVAGGTKLVKVMLCISRDEQRARLEERLRRPDKHWKYNPGDVTERGYWDAYQEAYQGALTRTSTKNAPWYVVPADRKWYARWAVQQLLLDAFADLAPTYPDMGWDVEGELARLEAS